jgi:hypothetical protein
MPGARPYTLEQIMQHPLARMLPLFRWQAQVYRMGERIPPSALADHGPVWEAQEFTLDPLGTLQARVNLQRDFSLISVAAKCTVDTVGGFRVQMYDLKKRYRFADRSINFGNLGGPVANISGNSPSPFFLREPYRFEVPDSQIMMQVQNMENAPNVVNLALYGQVLRFNEPGLAFPGGNVTGWDWGNSIEQQGGGGGQ